MFEPLTYEQTTNSNNRFTVCQQMSSYSFKIVAYKRLANKSLLYKQDSALHNPQRLICYSMQPTNQPTNQHKPHVILSISFVARSYLK